MGNNKKMRKERTKVGFVFIHCFEINTFKSIHICWVCFILQFNLMNAFTKRPRIFDAQTFEYFVFLCFLFLLHLLFLNCFDEERAWITSFIVYWWTSDDFSSLNDYNIYSYSYAILTLLGCVSFELDLYWLDHIFSLLSSNFRF